MFIDLFMSKLSTMNYEGFIRFDKQTCFEFVEKVLFEFDRECLGGN